MLLPPQVAEQRAGAVLARIEKDAAGSAGKQQPIGTKRSVRLLDAPRLPQVLHPPESERPFFELTGLCSHPAIRPGAPAPVASAHLLGMVTPRPAGADGGM